MANIIYLKLEGNKQGLISKDDFIETVNYQIANGEIIEGTKIFLRKIEIGQLKFRITI